MTRHLLSRASSACVPQVVREDGMLPAAKARASWRKRLKRPGDGNATMSDAMRAELEEVAAREEASQQQAEPDVDAYGEESQSKKLEHKPKSAKRRFDLSKEVRACSLRSVGRVGSRRAHASGGGGGGGGCVCLWQSHSSGFPPPLCDLTVVVLTDSCSIPRCGGDPSSERRSCRRCLTAS